MATTTADFRKSALKALTLAHSDSNDREIEALREALFQACSLLGIDAYTLSDEAYARAEAKGLF